MIADDQELIRESLKVVLDMNPDMEVVGTAENGKEVMSFVGSKQPDVILMDVRMPEMDGVLCTKAIKERYPGISIIILTTFDDDEYVYNALKYGASGYLLKGVSVTELTDAIRKVISGGTILNPAVVNKVVKLFSRMLCACGAKHRVFRKTGHPRSLLTGPSHRYAPAPEFHRNP